MPESGASSVNTRRTRAGLRSTRGTSASKAVSHSPQSRAAAPSVQRGDHGQREVFEVRQLLPVADDRRDAWRVLVLVPQLAQAQVVFVRQTLEPPLPSIEPLDDVGLDQQLLPAPRGPERAGDDAAAIALGRRRRLLAGSGSSARSSSRTRPEDRSSVGGDQLSAGGSAAAGSARSAAAGTWPSERYSAKRRAERCSSAQASKREERAAGRIGTSRPALEPGRHAGASQRVLEQPEVGVRRTQQDGHLVERHAAVRLGQHTARDLHRLAPFARRGEQRHRFVDRPGGRAVDGEEVLLQARERRTGRRPSTSPRRRREQAVGRTAAS